MFLTNKHVVVALIVAPILAILSYFAVDNLVAEQPHAAEYGQSYELIEQSNCRYNSGRCSLKNGNFELMLTANWLDSGQVLLELESAHPLEGVMLSEVEANGREKSPRNMQQLDALGARWQIEIASDAPDQDRLHLVASVGGSLYFAEAALKFSTYETSGRSSLR